MIERNMYLSKLIRFKDKDLIKVVTGIRRCGKSTLFDLFCNYLLENGVKEKQIIRINLENPIFNELDDYLKLYNYVMDKVNSKEKYYVFLDEVQNVEDFQKACDGLYINKNIDLYITGSNAFLLSGELATLLSGRYIEIKMLPLSFKEYISAFPNNSNIEKLFSNYISSGSFPYVTNFDDQDDIEQYIKSIYDSIILKDIVARKKYPDYTTLQSIINFMLDNIGNMCSINKITNTLNSNGKNMSVHTVEGYIESITECFMFYKVNRYDVKGRQYLKTGEKYYVSDLGFRYFILGRKYGDMGHILENVVYLELLHRGYDVFIGKVDDYEIDFIAINGKEKHYFQVAETLRGDGIIDRELRSLKKANDNYPKTILTMDVIAQSDLDGIKIKNILDWLQEKE